MPTRKASKAKPKVVKKTPAKKTLKDFAEKVAHKVVKKVTTADVEEAFTSGSIPIEAFGRPQHRAPAEPIIVDNEHAVVPEPVLEPVQVWITPSNPAGIEYRPTIVEIAAKAWDAVKASDDASYVDCQPDFKTTLLAHAEGVQHTHTVMDGDTNLAKFEREVFRLLTGG